MVGVIALVSGHDGPENPRVLVGERYDSFLPTAALTRAMRPLRDRVVVVLAGQHGSLSSLNQQGVQIVAATLGDAAQAGLAAAGVLLWRQSQPGAELGSVLELLEVTDRGHHRRCGDGPDPLERGGSLDLLVVLLVGSNALIAPLDMLLELAPVFLGSLQHKAGDTGDVIASVFQYVVEMLPQDGGCLGQHNSELGQQTTDAVHAGRALFLEGFAQAVHAQHALLGQRLGRHEVHVRSRSSLADGCRIVGVVLATLALDPIRRDELRRDHAGIETTFV